MTHEDGPVEGADRDALPETYPSVRSILDTNCEDIPNHDGTAYRGCRHAISEHAILGCDTCRCHRRLLDLVWSAAFVAGLNAAQGEAAS